MINALLQSVQLRPHGDKLLTSSARFWFRSVSVLILAMALSEAVAWSYLGYLFGSGSARWLTAAFAGGMMFVVVWIVDTSLVTLDRAWTEHAKTILGLNTQSRRESLVRDTFRFGLRIGLLMASLLVTSPYLAQVVFHKDIEASLNSDATQSLNVARDRLTKQFDDQLTYLNLQIERKRLAYEKEVAGKGQSGRYGAGPAAQAMLADIGKIEGERNRLRTLQDDSLGKFNSLAKNWAANRDQISALYNIQLPETSISENRRVLEELRTKPENQAVELAVRTFLAIIFCGLLLLKLFEPSSVRLYLSEVLQQEYDRYLAGVFDAMLHTFERSTHPRASMPPQRLYDFLARVWMPASTHPRTVAATRSLALLENMRLKINVEVEETKAEVQRVCSAASESEQSLAELKSAISSVSADLEQFRSDLESASFASSSLDERARLEYQSLLRGKIAKADLTLHELQDSIPSETEKHKRACDAVLQIETRLKDRQNELLSTQEQIQEVRSMLSRYVGNAASAALGSSAF